MIWRSSSPDRRHASSACSGKLLRARRQGQHPAVADDHLRHRRHAARRPGSTRALRRQRSNGRATRLGGATSGRSPRRSAARSLADRRRPRARDRARTTARRRARDLSSGVEAELAIRSACRSVSRVNIRPIAARSSPGRSTPPASSAVSASRSAATRCAWVSASPISRRPHSASRPPRRRSAAIAARTRSTTNVGVPGVLERGDDQVAGVGVEVRRDLAVEVGGQPVADVRLDQALDQSDGAVCAWNRSIGLAERRHRRERVGAELARAARCSGPTWPNSALAIAASATLSSSVGASLASSASRSNAEISPYAIAPSRSTTASR